MNLFGIIDINIIKMAMVTIHRRLKEEGLKAQMIMQVHDELNFNVPNSDAVL